MPSSVFGQPPTATTGDYSPVYSVRGLRTVFHAFSALGADKKLVLLDGEPTATTKPTVTMRNEHNDCADRTFRSASSPTAIANNVADGISTPTSANVTATHARSASASASAAATAAANNPATLNRGSVVLEAVHNDPANGYGKFVYI